MKKGFFGQVRCAARCHIGSKKSLQGPRFKVRRQVVLIIASIIEPLRSSIYSCHRNVSKNLLVPAPANRARVRAPLPLWIRNLFSVTMEMDEEDDPAGDILYAGTPTNRSV